MDNLKNLNIDTVLYIDPSTINEEDERMWTTKAPNTTMQGTAGYREDPKLWGTNTFGANIQAGVIGMGRGWSCEVTDFKKYVVVDVSYHNIITGRSSHKVFLVVFNKGGDGIVLSTMSKWRSISGYSQALSYITSAARCLQNETNNRI